MAEASSSAAEPSQQRSSRQTRSTTPLKSSSDNDQAGLVSRMMELSVSPPRQRPTSPRTQTPPPAPHSGNRGLLCTPASDSGNNMMPRTHSSPSLMDASPTPSVSSRKGGEKAPNNKRLHSAAELTPITNNISSVFCDSPSHQSTTNTSSSGARRMVSPDHEGFLYGEACMNEAASSSLKELQPRRLVRHTQRRTTHHSSSREGAPSLPPLPVGPDQRSKSITALDTQAFLQETEEDDLVDLDASTRSLRPARNQQHQHIHPPVQLRKVYSLVAQRSYEQLLPQEKHQASHQYQPTRRLDEDLPLPYDKNQTDPIFQPPLPLEERQYSIPSLHMAHHVHGSMGSIGSFTDEEDNLSYLMGDDNASLSSRGSSLYLPEEGQQGDMVLKLGGVSSFPNPSPPPVQVVLQHQEAHKEEDEHQQVAVVLEEAHETTKTSRKIRRKHWKEKQAVEWLRTVEGSHEIAEAASSRFLTAGARGTPHA